MSSAMKPGTYTATLYKGELEVATESGHSHRRLNDDA